MMDVVKRDDSAGISSNATTVVLYPSSAHKVYSKCQNEAPIESISSEESTEPGSVGESVDSDTNSSGKKSLEESIGDTVRDDIKKKIDNILAEVHLWSDTEKLLLYLKLPGSKHCDKSQDEQDIHTMPLSTTRAEQTQAFHWIRCHLEECENNSTLPKHEVYDEYKAHCESVNAARVLSAPDFGKIIKCVFPNVKARRLGTRGNSKYCYSGIQKKRIVKSPQLPNLMAPASAENNLGNGGLSANNGDKIGDDQTLVAACKLVCEWANKLLGRVFGTLTELAKFLVGGSYVSSKSMSAFVVMSSNETAGPCAKLTLNSVKFSDEHALMIQKRKQTQQHLQRKIQQRQQHKQQQQHQLNLLLHPSTPTGKQFTPILPQTQKAVHVTQVSGLRIQAKPQQLQLSPKLQLVTSLKSPPTPRTPVIYNQTPQRTLGHLPSSTTLSPVTPSLVSPGMHSSSPYNTKSPRRSAPCTPRSGTITPSPANSTPRHTPNGETTRFVFTPITNAAPDGKIVTTGGDTSPPTLKRPMATHPGHGLVNEYCNHTNNNGISSPNTPIKENPLSPCKQPRMVLTNPPTTQPKRNNSFSQPLLSPRTPKRTGLNQPPSIDTVSQNSNLAPISLQCNSPRSHVVVTRSPIARRHNALSCSSNYQPAQSSLGSGAHGISHQPLACQNFSSVNYSNNSSQDCRFNQANARHSSRDNLLQNNFLLPSEQELVEICNQLTNTAGQGNRSHSVPPLPQHMLPRATTAIQPLTPQTNNRHQLSAQRLVNFSGHVDGLKELRDRVLHGDTNNNSSSGCSNTATIPSNVVYAAKRNLISELESVSSSPTAWPSSGIHQTKLPVPVIPDMNSDPLGGLTIEEIANEAMSGGFDMFVDATAEVLFPDSNSFAHAWNVGQPLAMDSCL